MRPFRFLIPFLAGVAVVFILAAPEAQTPGPAPSAPAGLMTHPYRLVTGWPGLPPGTKWGAAIGLIPDGTGGLWMQWRADPGIVHLDSQGRITASFARGGFAQAHGLCRDRQGNFWALDSGPFADNPAMAGRGFQVFKYSPDGALLLTLGKAGVARASRETFVGPSGCAVAPNGDIIIADGHWPRPSTAQQDGDRLVRFTSRGQFVGEWGRLGTGPGEFIGPHGLLFDSEGRLFVADRSNSRIQIFDKDMRFLDDWRHFGRPSGLALLKDGTLFVTDSESGMRIDGSPATVEGGGPRLRNPGWKMGIRIGSAKDGSLRYFIPGFRFEGLAADEAGNLFGGLTSACDTSPSGGCLLKWVRP
jgi:sugar lactone lactonase YvrE